MDNRCIDITSDGKEGIRHALAIIWSSVHQKATHYKVARYLAKTEYYRRDKGEELHTSHYTTLLEDPKGIETLILLKYAESDALPLPFPLTREMAAEFINGWLSERDFFARDQPDHDGDNGEGWRMFTDGWGHVASFHSAIVGVQPAWAMFGK